MIALLLTLELIARVLAGEVGPLGPDAMLLVASTMQERRASGEYGDTWGQVLAGYHAEAPATESARQVAWALVTGRIPAVGFLYAYSEQDMARMGCRTGDVVISRHELTLHLARNAPWGSE